MRKLIFLSGVIIGIIFTIVVVSVGCSESGQSEAEIKAMVQTEVANQLASLDDLTLSNLFIENDDGDIVAHLTSNPHGNGELSLSNSDNEIIAFIGSFGQNYDWGVLRLYNQYGEHVVQTSGSLSGDGMLCIWDKYGNIGFFVPSNTYPFP